MAFTFILGINDDLLLVGGAACDEPACSLHMLIPRT